MELKSVSLGFRGLEARWGFENEFNRYQKECQILRQLIQALDNEKVRAAIAEFLEEEPESENIKVWQLKVLRGEKQTELFEDGHTNEDGPDHPEKRDVPGGKDPVQQ